MRVAVIGRSEVMLQTANMLVERGYEIGVVVTSKEAPEYLAKVEEFANFADRVEAPFFRAANFATIHDRIAKLPTMQIAVSVNYAGVIAAEAIDLFPLGILNAHGGDLPRYRGNACQAWAILQGEAHIGLCVHRMVGGELDSGDIVAYDQFPLTERTKVGEVWDWQVSRIPSMFLQAIDALSKDANFRIRSQKDDPRAPLRCYPRRPEDGRIDWTEGAEAIVRLVNASGRPYAGAYFHHEGDQVTVGDAEVVKDGEVFLSIPGQVTRVTTDALEVASGGGKVRLWSLSRHGTIISPGDLVTSLRTRLS